MESEYFTTKDAAQYLGVSHQYLELARHRGEGPPYYKLSRAIRYKRSDLDEWMNRHQRLVETW
jgi:excisionase family DNA binding protein